MKALADERTTLLHFLLDKAPSTSKTKIRKLIKHGGVLVNGEPVHRPDHRLLPGQSVETRRPISPSPFPILYEDPYMIAFEKPPGLLSVATDRENIHTFYRSVNQYVQLRSNRRERIFIVHRLDREVSGIMLFAKTPEIKETLQKNWGETEKLYCALVEGHLPQEEGTIKSWLSETSTHKVYSCPEGPSAKHAVTHYRQLARYPRFTLVEIRLETGRKNQIRAHLSELGCPIVGDRKYGAATNPMGRMALHAFALSFTHPVSGKRIKLESPVPKVFGELRKKTGKASGSTKGNDPASKIGERVSSKIL